jgi:DHA1 family multidrug resistance protein-like MFS transporter
LNQLWQRMHGNLAALAAMASLRGVHSSVYNVIWQPFVLSLGASMPMLGFLNSLGGVSGLIPTVAQSLGGWLADRIGRKPFLIMASLATIAAYALFALAGISNFWLPLAVGVVVYGFSSLARPAISSMTAESVRSDRHGSAFSLMILAQTAPGIIMPALGGWAAVQFGYLLVFPVGIVLELLILLIIWRLVRETRPASGALSWHEAKAALLRSVVPPKRLMGFALAGASDVFFWGMGYGLLYGMLSETYQYSTLDLGLMAAVMSVTWAIVQMPVGRYIDRHPTRPLMILSEAMGIPLMLIWMTQSRLEVLLAAQVLMAVTAATWIPAANTYLARHTVQEDRSESFGRLNAFRGLIAFPAPALGGLLYQWGGIAAPLAANLAGIFVIIALLVFVVPETAEATC